MRDFLRVVIVLLVACLTQRSGLGQTTKLESRLVTARALYYTPTTAGLESFNCRVAIDWKGVLRDASGKEIKDDNPLLVYLNSVQLSLNDKLRGNGSLEWSDTSAPQEPVKSAAAQMKEGLSQMVSGFFDSWNGFLSGTMVPLPDKTTILTPQGRGMHLHAGQGQTILDEDYDENMLLTNIHAVSGAIDAKIAPAFTETSDGRIISSIQGEYRQPATAPPVYLTMGVEYGQVNGYRLPNKIHYQLKNVLQMDINLSGCTTNSIDTHAKQ
jgi:hypothetical protein